MRRRLILDLNLNVRSLLARWPSRALPLTLCALSVILSASFDYTAHDFIKLESASVTVRRAAIDAYWKVIGVPERWSFDAFTPHKTGQFYYFDTQMFDFRKFQEGIDHSLVTKQIVGQIRLSFVPPHPWIPSLPDESSDPLVQCDGAVRIRIEELNLRPSSIWSVLYPSNEFTGSIQPTTFLVVGSGGSSVLGRPHSAFGTDRKLPGTSCRYYLRLPHHVPASVPTLVSSSSCPHPPLKQPRPRSLDRGCAAYSLLSTYSSRFSQRLSTVSTASPEGQGKRHRFVRAIRSLLGSSRWLFRKGSISLLHIAKSLSDKPSGFLRVCI